MGVTQWKISIMDSLFFIRNRTIIIDMSRKIGFAVLAIDILKPWKKHKLSRLMSKLSKFARAKSCRNNQSQRQQNQGVIYFISAHIIQNKHFLFMNGEIAMFIENGLVRCVGYRTGERLFTIGNVYKVVNGCIRNDNGFLYAVAFDYRNAVEWLSINYYDFEPVENDTVICGICGEAITNGDYICVDGVIVCDSCRDDNVYFCDDCGRAMLEDNGHWVNNSLVCDDCFEHNYRECVCCGEYHYRNDMWNTDNGYVCDARFLRAAALSPARCCTQQQRRRSGHKA
jgi:hypothetical protein